MNEVFFIFIVTGSIVNVTYISSMIIHFIRRKRMETDNGK
jgi:hypothetical protein